MVSLELQRMVEQMLGTPGSVEYEAAREILNDRPTLYDAVVAAGLTDNMPTLKKAETYWIFATMPDTMSDKILQRLRVALNVGLTVTVAWSQGDWNLVIGHTNAGIRLYIATPVPDLSQLQPGAFAGAMA